MFMSFLSYLTLSNALPSFFTPVTPALHVCPRPPLPFFFFYLFYFLPLLILYFLRHPHPIFYLLFFILSKNNTSLISPQMFSEKKKSCHKLYTTLFLPNIIDKIIHFHITCVLKLNVQCKLTQHDVKDHWNKFNMFKEIENDEI